MWNEFDLMVDESMTELYVSSGMLESQLENLIGENVIDLETSIKVAHALLLSKHEVKYSLEQVMEAMLALRLAADEKNQEDLCYST